MPNILRYIIFGVYLMPFTVTGQGVWQNFHHLTIEEGLPSNFVQDVLQDEKGYIWFATEAGLCKFDGYSFKNYTVEDGIPKNNIRKVIQDKKKQLWILTQGEMSYFDGNNFTYIGMGDKRIVSVLEDSSGNMWFSSARTLFYKKAGLPVDSITDIDPGTMGISGTPYLKETDDEGKIWIYNQDGFHVLNGQTIFRHIPLSFAINNENFSPATCVLHNKEIVYSSDLGLVNIRSNGEQVLISDKITDGPVNAIVEDHSGDLWIGSKNGAFRLQQVGRKWKPVDHYLAGIPISQVMEDVEGNLWFTSQSNGVFLLLSNANGILERNALVMKNLGISQTNQIYDIQESPDGRLMLGLSSGHILSVSGEIEKTIPQVFDFQDSLKSGEIITSFLPLQGNTILVLTNLRLCLWENNTLQSLHGFGAAQTLKAPHRLSQDKAGNILILTDSYLLDCTRKDLYLLLKPDGVSSFIDNLTERNNFHSNPRTQIAARDATGTIWYSWPKGLSSGLGENMINYYEKENIFRTSIVDIQTGTDSTVWLATQGNGTIVLKNGGYHKLDLQKELKGNVCNSILLDESEKKIWIATNRGIAKIQNYVFGQKNIDNQWFDQKDGIISDKVKKVIKYKHDIFVLTDLGLTVFDEEKIQKDEFKPPVYLTRVVLNGNEVDLKDHYTYPDEGNKISIHYSGISFRNLGKLSYQYKLEKYGVGEQDAWAVTTQPWIDFQALSPGKYIFTIRAISRDGPISEKPIKITLVIQPPFYRTWWFIVILICLALLMLFFLFRFLSSEKQKVQLEMTVRDKTLALTQKVEELARNNQDMEQFTYVASHDLKTPLRTIIGHLQLLERRYMHQIDEEGQSFINYAVQGAKHMFNIINDLLDYTRLGNEEMEGEQLNLNEIVDTVTQNLTNLIEEKKAKIEVLPLPQFFGSSYQWELLFQNLIGNGLKFNRSENPLIIIEAKDSPGYYIVSVKDNGVGIGEEYLAKIFEPFQRLNVSEFPGTGIGLAICKRIVEVRGGTIWAESEPGKGTTFFFTVPKSHRST
ncbi:MAG: two-component regulator propeller domain-containing protein [Bacteroidia bacterium]